MDLLFSILKQINVALACIVVLYAWAVFTTLHARVLITLLIVMFTASTGLYFPEGYTNEWLKHAPFYIGQLCYALFLLAFVNTQKLPRWESIINLLPYVILFIVLGSGTIISLSALEHHGVQHILAAPFFFISVVVASFKYQLMPKTGRPKAFYYFVLSGLALTFIHVTEYVFETKNLAPSLSGEIIELFEFIWFYIALAIFSLGIAKFNRVNSSRKSRLV